MPVAQVYWPTSVGVLVRGIMVMARCVRAYCSSGGVAARQLVGCNVYVSEGNNSSLLQHIKKVIQLHPGVALVTSFTDAHYNRTSFTLASDSTQKLSTLVVAVAQHALLHVDMTRHKATHPRLGAVDHISCHPVTHSTPMALAVETAAAVAQQLSQPPSSLPVYLYGAAHPISRTLADIRRQLGYFRSTQLSPAGTHHGVWLGLQLQQQGACSSPPAGPGGCTGPQAQPPRLPLTPDMGPTQVSVTSGVSTVGAVPWVVNFNIPLLTTDLKAGQQIARAVSQRGGGLPAVEAMALCKGDTIEVACNLLDSNMSPPMQVLEHVRMLARDANFRCGEAYQIGLSAEDVALHACKYLMLL